MKNLITRLLTGVIMLSAFAMPLNAVSPLESTPNISSLDLASVNSWTPELSTEFRLKSTRRPNLSPTFSTMRALSRGFVTAVAERPRRVLTVQVLPAMYSASSA